jgi:hypothetical protein
LGDDELARFFGGGEVGAELGAGVVVESRRGESRPLGVASAPSTTGIEEADFMARFPEWLWRIQPLWMKAYNFGCLSSSSLSKSRRKGWQLWMRQSSQQVGVSSEVISLDAERASDGVA